MDNDIPYLPYIRNMKILSRMERKYKHGDNVWYKQQRAIITHVFYGNEPEIYGINIVNINTANDEMIIAREDQLEPR